MALTKKQFRNFTALFWLHQGRLPAGTNNSNFDQVTMADLDFDDPPVPGALELEKYTKLMEYDLNKLGVAVPGIRDVLANNAKTMADLYEHCYDNQQPFPLQW